MPGVLAFSLHMFFRLDKGSLRSPKRRKDGRVIVDGVLTRSGVFSYKEDDGTERLEYRPPSEVFHEDSLASFAFVPVTDNHPPAMLDIENAKAASVGSVGERVRRDGDHVIASMVLSDKNAIAKLDAGKTALSCGYQCDLENTPGITETGERYDAIQRNIRGNHVALVDVGRAGPEARIRMDGALTQTDRIDHKEKPMLTNLEAIDKITSLSAELATANARADKAEGERDSEKSRADKAEGERDSAKQAGEEADKARTDAAEGEAKRFDARVQLQAIAAKILGDDQKFDGLSDQAVQALCVLKVENFDCKDKSAEYVQARFDAASAKYTKEAAVYDGLEAADADRLDGEQDEEQAAHARMLKNNAELCKTEG